MTLKHLAIIDDYEHAAHRMADWSRLHGRVAITTFHDHLEDELALADRLKPYEIVWIMRERTPFPRSLLKRLPNLEHLLTSGMRNFSIDLDAAEELGIVVSGTPILPYPAAEHAWALILALAKRIPADDRAVREGQWGHGLNVGLKGKTLGVVGLGRLGSQVARIGQAFDMRVIAWSQNLTSERCAEVGVEFVSKDTVFRDADFVTIHLHVGERNRGLVGVEQLAAMKPTAYLINTSRGPIVDEQALIAALTDGAIAGAGLDVFDVEPLPSEHVLRRLSNTVITPHQGYVTEENYRVFFEAAVENIAAWLDGEVINAL